MQKLEDVIKDQYGDVNEAGRQTGTSYTQIGRWISYGSRIDSSGEVWSPKGNLYKNRDSAPAVEYNDGWINVENRLPDFSGYVLVAYGDRVTTALYMKFIRSERHGRWGTSAGKPNLWRPLPEPPKELSK